VQEQKARLKAQYETERKEAKINNKYNKRKSRAKMGQTIELYNEENPALGGTHP
jgi:hypothetical protein